MARLTSHFALAALMTVGLIGCASNEPTYAEPPIVVVPPQPQPPVVVVPSQSQPPIVIPSQTQIIEGQVVRNEGDAYIIREPSGRQTRVYLDRNTVKDNVAVGDYVVVRFDGSPASAYATSITRRTVYPVPPRASVLPRPLTIEGIVLRQDGNDYAIKDISGREIHLHVDNTTKRDGNITAGDRVVAITSTIPSDVPYMTMVYRLGNPNVFQGEVVRIDGNWYVVRDVTGREMRFRADNTVPRDGNIIVGDRVMVITSTMPPDAPYVMNMYRLGNPYIIQGEVIWTDGSWYVVRDVTGREVRLYTNSSTVWNDTIAVGDRIIVYTGPPSTVHVDYLAKS